MVVAGGGSMRGGLSHGVGLAIERDAQNRCVCARVLPGGAAAFSGQVFKGDVIVKINNHPTASMSEEDVPQWFLGDAGTVVELSLMTRSLNSAVRNVRLVRQPISTVSLQPETDADQPQQLAGIGAVLATDVNGNLVVSRLVYGGAAAYTKPSDLFGEDRLKKMDQIVAIDGRDVRGLQPVDVRPMLLGPVGSNVTLMVKRAKYDRPVEIVLRRRAESMQTQFVPLEASTAYPVVHEYQPSPPAQDRASIPQGPNAGYAAPPPPPWHPQERLMQAPQPVVTQVQAPVPPPAKVGVGLVLKERVDGVHVVKRLKPGQAAAHCAQIEAGDVLTHVDSLDIARGVASQFLADLIAGPEGSVVNLTFEKPDGSRVSINLLRGTADYIAEILRAENEGRPPPPAPAQERQYHPPSAHDPSPNVAHVPGTAVQDDSSLAAAVGVSLSLDEDYDSLVTAPERLQAFNVQFKQDLAHAVDCNTGRIQLVGLQRAEGIIVDVNLFPDLADSRSPKQLAAELASQVADPRSRLRNAPSTRRVNRADVHVGHVSPPPNAVVVSAADGSPGPFHLQQGAPARSPPEAREVTDGEGNRTEGVETDYKGVGLMLREVEGQQHVVRRIVPQSAAEKSGVIRVGDVLVAVDGRSVQSAPVDRLIPGPDGSAVNLTLRRAGAGGEEYKVSLVRGSLGAPADASPIVISSPRDAGAEKRAAAARMQRGGLPPQAPQANGIGPMPGLTITGGGGAVPASSIGEVPSGPPPQSDGVTGGKVQSPTGAPGREIKIMLRNEASASAGGFRTLVLPETLPELLMQAASALACNEITRLFTAAGDPIVSLEDIAAGDTILLHAAAKGQFESWSLGLVVKRRYVLISKMGDGGLGALWAARDSQTGSEVVLVEEGDETALRVRDAILAERGQGEESERRRWREERFLREMQIIMRLQSRHVCCVFDHGLQQGRMFQVLERLQGQSLAEALDRDQTQFLGAMTKRFAIELLLGLEAAHVAGLTHGNLVPANVFLSSDGVKVLGLGVALWEPEMISNSAIQLPAKAMPQYMSPEQVSGRLTDHRSDLWTVGVLMFRCVCGKLPFDAGVFLNIVQAIVTGPTPTIDSSAGVSPDFARIVAKAMSKDPDHRYESAKAMRLEIEAL